MNTTKCSYCDEPGKFKKPNDEERYSKKFDYYADKAYFISMGEARQKALADVGYTLIDCPYCPKKLVPDESKGGE